MLFSGRGIVLGFLKYGDSSVIARIYTREHGIVSFIVQGVFRKKARISSSQLQALTLLDMVYYHRENRPIQNIKEVRANPPLNSLQMNVVKSSLAIFGAEVLQKALKNFEKDYQLFDMVENSILELNQSQDASIFWPHHFILALSQTLGFAPSMQSFGRYFHLKEGLFTNIPLNERDTTTPEETQLLVAILSQEKIENIARSLRNSLLDKLLTYFAYHVGGFQQLKSLDVLRDVMK